MTAELLYNNLQGKCNWPVLISETKQDRWGETKNQGNSEKLGHRGHGEKFTPAVENMVTVSLRTHNRAESERTGAFPSQ